MKVFYEATVIETGYDILLDLIGVNYSGERLFAPHASNMYGNIESMKSRYVESKLDNLREMILVPLGSKICDCDEEPVDVLASITNKLELYSSLMKTITDNPIDSTELLNILSLIPPQKGTLQEEIRLLRVRLGSRKSMKIHEKIEAGIWKHGIPIMEEPTDIGHVITGFCTHSPDTKEKNRLMFTRFTSSDKNDLAWAAEDGERHRFSDLKVVREIKEGE